MAEPRRYRTQFGRRATYLLLSLGGGFISMVGFWWVGVWPMVVLGAIVLCLAAWMVLGTGYVMHDGVLAARSGPLRMRVRLRDITAVHRRTVERGVTLGLGTDFIGIEYGANALNVSPRDADDFIEAVRRSGAGGGPGVSRDPPATS